ncbi:MAG: NUDIX domain-containing protein [Spirosomataceae bacterium]
MTAPEPPIKLANEAELLPSISIDCVIFGFHENQLKVMLLVFRQTNLFALPGGFVDLEEDVDTAAQRILARRTGVKDVYLEQFHTFGNYNRGDYGVHSRFMKANHIPFDHNHWLLKRYVSIGYYALVDFSEVTPTPDHLSDSCTWYDIHDLPTLILDHRCIIQKALETLRRDLYLKLIGFNLLPETFTMNQLQVLYETILDEKLVRSNFQRKMLSLNVLERVQKKQTGRANKAPYLYRFVGKKV